MEHLKVAAATKPKALAGAIAEIVRMENKVELTGVGAGAVNQTVKAIAIARGFVATAGMDLTCKPGFTTVSENGKEWIGIRFIVEAL